MAKEENTALIIGGAAVLLYLFGNSADSKTQANDIINPSADETSGVLAMMPYAQAEVNAAPAPGISINFILAQSGLETGWWKLTNADGSPTIFAASNNAFGIHADSSWTGQTYTPPGTNNAPFRAYASVADSFADHLAFLLTNKNYAPLWNSGTNDPIVWASIIDETGYSQTPGYGAELAEIIPTVQTITKIKP